MEFCTREQLVEAIEVLERRLKLDANFFDPHVPAYVKPRSKLLEELKAELQRRDDAASE